jgi:hypothetical protein
MDRLDLYRRAYEFEIARIREATDHATWSAPIIMALASFTFYAATIASTISCDLKIWFYVSVLFCCFGLIGMLATSFLAIFNYEWAYMDHPEDLENYWKSIEIHKTANSISIKNYSENVFANSILEKYITCATLNGHNNDRRSYFVYLSKYFLMISILFSIVIGVFILTSKL